MREEEFRRDGDLAAPGLTNRRSTGMISHHGICLDRMLTLRGLRFHYIEWGNATAPAVVFLHGITGHARTWDDEAAALSSQFRVLALDQRGHGDSDAAPDGDYTITTLAEDLALFVNALDLSRFSLVGFSMGGRAAMAYAGQQSERLTGLVVVDARPDSNVAGTGQIYAEMGRSPERFNSVEEAFAYARADDPRYQHWIARGLRRLQDGGLAWKYDRAIRDAIRAGRWSDPVDLWSSWIKITCPTLLIRGSASMVLRAETAKRMIELRPQAKLVEVPGAAHWVPGEQPEAFMRLLRDFLES